ncbi:MAG: universal stress protein [Emcibacteraceae bacterium]|nr:universal stress protein [Emcibacteraceae bacterium]
MYKTILVPIGNDEEVETRLKAAISIGEKFDAHINALHVIPTLKSLERQTPYAYYSYELYANIWDIQKQKASEQKNAFLDRMQGNYDKFEWCAKEGDFMRILKLKSRSCNLSIISQGEDTYSDLMGTMAKFLMESSTAVLTVPVGKPIKNIGDNIMIAWDNSVEASHAVQNALPFLQSAKKVTIFSISEERKHISPTADICLMLKRMGIDAQGVDEDESSNRSERILKFAEKTRADLIVAGAWGHKRLLEVIFGGVTKSLYTNQKIPILFSH